MSLMKQFPEETTGGPPSPPPRRLNAGTGVEADDGVARTAMCLYFPRFSKKKQPAMRSASARRVASWWPWSPTPHDDDGSASFKHWGQSSQSRSQLSSRATPRVRVSSSSFPSSPASASSFVSTAKSGQDR
ncbi:hypothetical protein PAHAL_5G125200 [Panicum hallii]|jgi:hypothetical protein|uniref:Uncharacterized protein n=1 Tax=Panicum hallii TaxID=206008 RepID=A0A2S3HQV2_9POAL|nr:uncharacterized protein LOC112894926 [Panicum hallii]PAN28019.1 hypothetical protein PAHAL_5G125200 [Panicum hallii]